MRWLCPEGMPHHLSKIGRNEHEPLCFLFLSCSTTPGSSVTQLLARDMDNDPLVFGVSGEEASRFFAVEPDTGVVWLRQPLDREVRHATPKSQPFSGGQWRRVAHHLFFEGEEPSFKVPWYLCWVHLSQW